MLKRRRDFSFTFSIFSRILSAVWRTPLFLSLLANILTNAVSIMSQIINFRTPLSRNLKKMWQEAVTKHSTLTSHISAPIATTILMNAGSILLGCIGGIIIGLLLWRFPRPDTTHTQFARITLLGTSCIGLMIGTYLVKYSCAGFLAALITSSMCAMKWKTDNKDKLDCVVSTYKYVWDSFALPLLFICLGLKFDFSTVSSEFRGIIDVSTFSYHGK